MKHRSELISCIILAGGEGKRVGGQDKGLIEYKDKKLIEHVIARMKPQVDEIIISANRNIQQYEKFGYKVVSDTTDNYLGPLAGINSALTLCSYDLLLVVACDMPDLPIDLAAKLFTGIINSDLAIAETEDRLQLSFMFKRTLSDSVNQSLHERNLRLMRWVMQQQPTIINFKNTSAFNNINQPINLD